MDIMTINSTTGIPRHMLEIKEIDDKSGPYCMSFKSDLDSLVQSIRRVGLINTPVLIEKDVGEKKYDIVLGFRRIKAMDLLGWKKIPCKILSKTEVSPLECLLMNLNDNLVTREFNVVEKGMAISRLSSLLQKAEIIKTYMPLLNLPSHEPDMIFYRRLEENLEEEIKESLVSGHLSLRSVKLMLEMDKDTQSSIFNLISTLKLNVNQQKNIIEYLNDISHSDNLMISDILKEDFIVKICDDTRMNNPQKANSVLMGLRSRIFPQLIDAEKAFKNMVSALDLPRDIRINAPPFFEAPDYRLEILFKNGTDLKEKIDRLAKTKELALLHDPWENNFNG